MTTRIKIYVAIGAALFLCITGYAFWSEHKIRKLETIAENERQYAEREQQHAAELESASRKYEEKIVFLETSLETLKNLAKKQDEELKALQSNSTDARAHVERARRIRSAAANADELCRKLAELGHAC